MWKFLIPALIAANVAFAQAPNQGQSQTQAQPNAGQATPNAGPSAQPPQSGGVTTLNSPGGQTQPNQVPNQAHINARAAAIQQIEQALQQLRQSNQ